MEKFSAYFWTYRFLTTALSGLAASAEPEMIGDSVKKEVAARLNCANQKESVFNEELSFYVLRNL
jgi:hypothetical protein